MHEAALAQAALPPPTTVLGLLLRPYSLGHELFLIREGNPICKYPTANSQQPIIRFQDLAQAALICCQGFEESRGMYADWFIGIKLWLWKRRIRRANFALELAAFLEYRASGLLEFPASQIVKTGSGPSGRPPGAPFLLRLQQFLMMSLGLSEAAAWDYPLGLAKMRWQTFWEAEGGLDLYNWHDAEFDKFIAEEEAKLKQRTANSQQPKRRGIDA